MTTKTLLDELDPIDRTIVFMRQERKTDAAIGEAVGLVRTAVSKRRKKLARRHGEHIFEPTRLLFTPQDVARRLGVRSRKIRELVREGFVTPEVRKGPHSFLSERSVQKLLTHPSINPTKPCDICGILFVIKRSARGYLRAVCRSEVCVLERNRRWVERRRLHQNHAKVSRRKKYEVLRNLVHRRNEASNDEWIASDNAESIACVETWILEALAKKGIIREQRRPKRTGFGRPEKLYVKRELCFVRYVYREYA